MAIEITDSIKQNLWRNHLIRFYEKHFYQLNKLMSFRITSSEQIVEKQYELLGKIQLPEPTYAFSEFLSEQLKQERNMMQAELEDLKKQWEALSADEKKRDYWAGIISLKILEEINRQLKDLKVAIVHHPNNEIEFIDTETKISLKSEKS